MDDQNDDKFRNPELELARQKVKVHPSEETVECLLEATPYAIGTEFVDAEWIGKLFAGLSVKAAGTEKWITDLSNEELFSLLRLGD